VSVLTTSVHNEKTDDDDDDDDGAGMMGCGTSKTSVRAARVHINGET